MMSAKVHRIVFIPSEWCQAALPGRFFRCGRGLTLLWCHFSAYFAGSLSNVFLQLSEQKKYVLPW